MSVDDLLKVIVSALISGGVVAVFANALLARHSERIKTDFAKMLEVAKEKRTWQEALLSELLGPVVMQLDRTKRAFQRWDAGNKFVETQIIKTANEQIRELLLTKSHLLPTERLPDAQELVQHYDRWLEEYYKLRSESGSTAGFVFVGPQGYPFQTAWKSVIIPPGRNYMEPYHSDALSLCACV